MFTFYCCQKTAVLTFRHQMNLFSGLFVDLNYFMAIVDIRNSLLLFTFHYTIFKALLFICEGCVIHNLKGNQIFFMGNLIPCIVINISNLALCGIPFLGGFYSKDLLLEYIYLINLNVLIIFFIHYPASILLSFAIIVINIGSIIFNSIQLS